FAARDDLEQVFVGAGTGNRREVFPPVAVTIHSINDEARYDSNDFEERVLVDAETTAEKVEEKTAAFDWKFTVNLQAEPPAEKFALLCQYDPLFLETYKKNRPEWQ